MTPLYLVVGPTTDMPDLSNLKQKILLDIHKNGDNVPGNIADRIDFHPNSVSRALRQLSEETSPPLVRNKGRGVWTLTESGEQVADSLVTIANVTQVDAEPSEQADEETE